MSAKKGRVLCVDDEPNILRSLQWLLQREFEVLTAPSGADGLALVRQNDFDVIVSDQRMPGMVGSEFLREVRKLSPRSMRILLTGYSDMQAILRSVNESEVFRFINKPWNIAELPRIVAQAATIARAPAVPAAEPAAAAPARSRPETILLLDDDQSMPQLVREAIGPHARVLHADNLAEGVALLNDQEISVVVSETRVGHMDATRLLKLLKNKHPHIVSVVFSSDADAAAVIELINQGQIYRFIPKPIKPGFLKVVITSAMLKHQQLVADPESAGRHAVDQVAAGTAEKLLKDVQQVARQVGGQPSAAANDASGGSFMQRIAGGLRRLLAG